jgi:hypothetical protein
MQDWFTVVIPTRDSAAWMGPLLAHYQARGVTPTLLLDDRTTDHTRAIAEQAGAPIVDIHGFTNTEAIVRVTKDCVTTPWALFIHDDEAPSEKLFGRLRGPQPPAEVQSVAIPRRWAWYEPGKALTYGRSDHWHDRGGRPGTDHVWRLFRPDQVRFVPAMHTEGFYIDRWSRFPLDTYNIHFEWVIRSHAQRAAKLRRYDEVRLGYGSFFKNMYLPESQPEGVIEYLPFESQAYDDLASVYFAARGPDAKIPRRSLRVQLARARNLLSDKAKKLDFSPPADRKELEVKPERELPDPCNADLSLDLL